jgi:hypothetical protein
MNADAALTAQKPRKTRLRGRPRIEGKLAECVGHEFRRSRIMHGLDLSTAAELAETTPKRLPEIEEAGATATISTIERSAEKVKLDWSPVFVTPADAGDANSSTTEKEDGRGAR